MIRDPRDVILSGMRYHCWSHEAHLHQPDPLYDGLTYQQKLKSLDADDDRLLFEMNHIGRETIEAMLGFEDGGVFRTCKYEDLVTDVEMIRWHELLAWLGFQGRELLVGLEAVYQHSLFGDGGANRSRHVQSGQTRQWQQQMSSRILDDFQARFPDALARLGYE